MKRVPKAIYSEPYNTPVLKWLPYWPGNHAEHKNYTGQPLCIHRPACPALLAVVGRADSETGPRAYVSLRRSLPLAYGEVLQLVQQRTATYEEYGLRRSATAASVRD